MEQLHNCIFQFCHTMSLLFTRKIDQQFRCNVLIELKLFFNDDILPIIRTVLFCIFQMTFMIKILPVVYSYTLCVTMPNIHQFLLSKRWKINATVNEC